jgi:hypothetical protein
VARSDSWDRRFLGDAMELGETLRSLSSAFSGTAPAGFSGDALAVAALLPGLADERALPVRLAESPNRPAGEVLVGAAIAMLAGGGSFDDRWDAVFEFRGDGAEWGIVALDRRVGGNALLTAVRQAVNANAAPEVALPPATTVPPATTTPPPPGSTTSTSPPTTDAPPGPSPTTPPPTTPPPTVPTPTLPPVDVPPVPVPPPETDDVIPDTGVEVIDDLVQPVEDLLGSVLG